LGKKISKIISWILLILTVLSLWLVVRRPSGPKLESSPEAAQAFDDKWADLLAAHQQGKAGEASLSGVELNSKIQQILAGATASGWVSLSAVAVRIEGNLLVCLVTMDVLGVKVYVTLGGRPTLRDHRLEFDLTDVKMGSMPVPASVVSAALKQKLEAPELRDMMRMPDFITDVHIENNQLVIQSQ
jgi:hypothetical protein